MPDVWGSSIWLPGDPVNAANLNTVRSSIRTLGFGQTPGTVTWNGNQNHIGSLGNLTFHTTGGIVQDAWTTATLSNSWVSFGGVYSAGARYRKDKAGWVDLELPVKNGTTGVIMTLPVGFRPVSNHAYTVGTGVSGTAFCALVVDTSGVVQVTGSYSNTGVFAFVRFPLD